MNPATMFVIEFCGGLVGGFICEALFSDPRQ